MAMKSTQLMPTLGWQASIFRYLMACFLLMAVFSSIISPVANAAPKSELLSQWSATVSDSITTIDHGHWQTILDRYVVVQQQQSYVDYAALVANKKDVALLTDYIKQRSQDNPLLLNRQQQQAYWINVYNALTVKLIVDNYPVKSITKLGKGLFTFGPWDQVLIEVNQQPLSLNNIEHGILRPIYNDPRIHYAVNCASIGCPNLLPTAFTADNTARLLTQAAKQFINHPKAVNIKKDKLILSKIYQWYVADFDGDIAGVLTHIQQYASQALKEKLAAVNTASVAYEYDWDLNELPH